MSPGGRFPLLRTNRVGLTVFVVRNLTPWQAQYLRSSAEADG